MQDKFLEMYNLQNTLNTNTNGTEWTKGVTLQGRTINWSRCMYMEACEAIDSLNWKHWKDINKEDDIENVKIELVDIWHFLMSQHIVDMRGNIEQASQEAMDAFNTSKDIKTPLTLIQALEGIVASSSTQNLPLEFFYIALSKMDGFTMEDVYLLYIGKNCLNQFRQDNGYKDGSYIKMWDGKEDNVYMQSVLNGNPNISYIELYAYLKAKYERVNK